MSNLGSAINVDVGAEGDFLPLRAHFDLAPLKIPAPYLRKDLPRLPQYSEPELVRYFTNLSYQSHGVDNGAYPLGSCTMKYNPKRNDYFANLEGFRFIHPHQPIETMAGMWQMMYELQKDLCNITAMDEACLTPAAGAHGEFAGLLVVKAYFAAKNEKRPVILIPDSAHGTNPSSAAMVGYQCKMVPTDSNGHFDLKKLCEVLDNDVAAIMMTNPSTLGLFEKNILEIANYAKQNGSLLYYDGANLNALLGIARPGDMGFDLVHVNTHKTFSTPHGGGGPGAGPIAVKYFLKEYLPEVVVDFDGSHYRPRDSVRSVGKIKSFYGHISVILRAYAYIRTLGASGLKKASELAVLNANYIQSLLHDCFPPVYEARCMHECLLSGEKLSTTTISFAKRLIDYDIHPPTMLGAGCVYFPGNLVAAMLIEPTETESKRTIDTMVATFKQVFDECSKYPNLVENAPHSRKVGKIINLDCTTELN